MRLVIWKNKKNHLRLSENEKESKMGKELQ